MILFNVYLTFPDINLIYGLTSNFGPDYLQIMLMWVTAVFPQALQMINQSEIPCKDRHVLRANH